MELLILTAFIFVVAFTALAIGVMFKRGCIRGSCQGSIQAGDGSGCRCGKYDFEKKCKDKKHGSTPLK